MVSCCDNDVDSVLIYLVGILYFWFCNRVFVFWCGIVFFGEMIIGYFIIWLSVIVFCNRGWLGCIINLSDFKNSSL